MSCGMPSRDEHTNINVAAKDNRPKFVLHAFAKSLT